MKLQSITKKHVSPVFQPYVFPEYLRNRLSYKKSIYIFLYQFLKSSPLKDELFKSDDTISGSGDIREKRKVEKQGNMFFCYWLYIMCLFIFEEKVEILDQNTLSLNPDQKVDDPILGSR